MSTAPFPGLSFPDETTPGYSYPDPNLPPPGKPPVYSTISAPPAPPPQQFSNIATLIMGNIVSVSLLLNTPGGQIMLVEGVDYTRSGGVVTMVVPPTSSDALTALVYTIGEQLGGASPFLASLPWSLPVEGAYDGVSLSYSIVFGPTIMGGVDGRNNLFTWGVQIPRGQIFRNGILQTLNADVVMGPTAMVFLPGAIPQPGDVITMLGYSS